MDERWAEQPTTEDLARAGERPRVERPEQPGVAESEAARAEVRATSAPGAAAPVEATPLFEADEAERFRSHWTEIQAGFVDEPRQAVEQADKLVAQIIKRLAEIFADERSRLEGQWAQGGDVSTEDLRVALQRYRSLFDRLLSV